MKKFMFIMCTLILFWIGVRAQDVITVSSGGNVLASGVNVIGSTTICTGSSITLDLSFNGTLNKFIVTSNPAGFKDTLYTNPASVTVTPTAANTDYWIYCYKDAGPYVGYVRITVFAAPLPTVFPITVDGNTTVNGEFCDLPGATGNVDGLTSSQIGVDYQLQLSAPPNTVIATVPGTGMAITFPPQVEGSFRIVAISSFGCIKNF